LDIPGFLNTLLGKPAAVVTVERDFLFKRERIQLAAGMVATLDRSRRD